MSNKATRIFLTIKDIQTLTGLGYHQASREYNYSLALCNKKQRARRERGSDGKFTYTRAQRLSIADYAQVNGVTEDEIRKGLGLL